jgi:cell division protease FtsH
MQKISTFLCLTLLLLSPGPQAHAALARVVRVAPVKSAPTALTGALRLGTAPQLSQLSLSTTLNPTTLPSTPNLTQTPPATLRQASQGTLSQAVLPAMPAAAAATAAQPATARQALTGKLSAAGKATTQFQNRSASLSHSGLRSAARTLFENIWRNKDAASLPVGQAVGTMRHNGLVRHDDETPPSDPNPDFLSQPVQETVFHSESVAKIAFDLESLAKTDPAAGLAKAQALLQSAETGHERRPEVLNAVMRFYATYSDVEALMNPLAWILFQPRPDQEIGIAFEGRHRDELIATWQKRDTQWAVRRSAARILRDRPQDFDAEAAVAILTRVYQQDLNASVRLMAQAALAQYGVTEPGQEPFVIEDATPKPRVEEVAQKKQPGPFRRLLRSIAIAAMLWMGVSYFMAPKDVPPTPSEQTQIVQQLSEREVADIQADDSLTAVQKKAYIEMRRHHLALEEQARKDYEDIEQAEDLTDYQRRMLTEERRQSLADERSASANESFTALMEKNAEKSGSGIGGMILNALIFVGILVGFQYFMMRKQMGGKGGAMSIFKSKSRRVAERPTTRFHDIAGIDEVVDEAREIVDFLKNPGKYSRLGGNAPKGVLLEGGPGLGKTALARAIAGESSAAFYSMSGSDFIEMFVGVGAKRVRELFEKANENSPAIIFIDEIDAVGKKRGGSGQISGGHDEREQTLNALLSEMDGFDNSRGVVVIAATNRIDVLDDALTRTGRFDKKITVGKPDLLGREAIMQIHGRNVRFDPDVDLHFIGERTWQMSGSDLEAVVNAAARFAARRNADTVSNADLSEAVDQIIMGAARPLPLTDEERRETAVHEAGHVLGALFGGANRIAAKVTIMPRGPALGFADIRDAKDKFSRKKSELEAQIVELLGGIAAEQKFLGETTTGPSNDLERATQIARTMVERLGMGGEEIGLAVAAPRNEFAGRDISEERARKIDAAVKKILDENLEKINAILEEQGAVHEALVEALLEKETLDRAEIMSLKAQHETKPEGNDTATLAGGLAFMAPLLTEQAATTGMFGVFLAISAWSASLFFEGLWSMIKTRSGLGPIDGISQLVYLGRWMLASMLLISLAHPFNLIAALVAFIGPGIALRAWKKALKKKQS